jgi:hypothetical protein
MSDIRPDLLVPESHIMHARLTLDDLSQCIRELRIILCTIVCLDFSGKSFCKTNSVIAAER